VQRSPIGLQSHPKDRRGSRETSSHGVAREYARFPLLRHPLVEVDGEDGEVACLSRPFERIDDPDFTVASVTFDIAKLIRATPALVGSLDVGSR